jgi:uncharacterized iron-regulated membrane protein
MTAMKTRRFWIAAHRYLGLASLAFLTVAALTGCLLCFRAPLDAALNADLFARPPGKAAVDPVPAVLALETAHPELGARSFPLALAPGANLPVMVGPNDDARPLGYDQVFLDAAGGHVVGARQIEPGWDRRHFMQGVYVLHYTLLGGAWGRWIMGLAALGWLIGTMVGLYLTLPTRPPFLRGWRRAWVVKTNGRLGRLLLDLHQASGLWLLIGATVLAFTSVSLNFFDEVVTPAVAALSPPRASPFDAPAPPSPPPRRIGFAQALGAGMARARARGLDWRPAGLAYQPDRGLYGVTFTKSGVIGYQGLGPVSYWFDAADGRFVYEDNPYQDSAGRKLTRALYPLHSGQAAGPCGVAVVFILGLATIEMCATGAYVWWTKRGSRIAARKLSKTTGGTPA